MNYSRPLTMTGTTLAEADPNVEAVRRVQRSSSYSSARSELSSLGVSPLEREADIKVNKTDIENDAAAVAPPTQRAPPPPVAPNGKAGSPYTERANPMNQGQTITSKDPKAAAQAAADMRNVVRRKLTGYVGFANLPNQWHRKSVRKGFNFNVMVVGEYL